MVLFCSFFIASSSNKICIPDLILPWSTEDTALLWPHAAKTMQGGALWSISGVSVQDLQPLWRTFLLLAMNLAPPLYFIEQILFLFCLSATELWKHKMRLSRMQTPFSTSSSAHPRTFTPSLPCPQAQLCPPSPHCSPRPAPAPWAAHTPYIHTSVPHLPIRWHRAGFHHSHLFSGFKSR